MELVTRLLLFASVALLAWTALTALVRPAARRLLEPISSHSRLDQDEPSEQPADVFRSDDDERERPQPRSRGPLRSPHEFTESNSDGGDARTDGDKVELRAATARKDAKLYGKPSERSAEMGEVHAGETIFIMKQSADWVLVLRNEGAMMGWMRRDNVDKR